MRLTILLLAILAAILPTCYGALYEDINDLPTLVYDYIVVGVCRSTCRAHIPPHLNYFKGRCSWECPRKSIDGVAQYHRPCPQSEHHVCWKLSYVLWSLTSR